MTVADVQMYFRALESSWDGLNEKTRRKRIEKDFPNYAHIGPYLDPSNPKVQRLIVELVSTELAKYKFDPLLAFEISQAKYATTVLHPNCRCYRKQVAKLRPIKTCSHRDRLIFAAWNKYLSRKHKSWLIANQLSEAVSAYVPETGKMNAHYAKIAFDYLQGRAQYATLAIDVQSFFDELPHDFLKANLLTVINNGDKFNTVDWRLYREVTKYSHLDKSSVKDLEDKLTTRPGLLMTRHADNWKLLRKKKLIKQNKKKGIPQGMACSGVLSNVAMMQFDEVLFTTAKSKDALYLRYADDIFIAASSVSVRDELERVAKRELGHLKLPLAEKKTEREAYDSTIDNKHPEVSYLGLVCQGSNVTVRQNGVNKFYDRTSRYINSYVSTCFRHQDENSRRDPPSRKKIKAIFSHTGKRNYYSYLRRASAVFSEDKRYKIKGILGTLKNVDSWIDGVFDEAMARDVPKERGCYRPLSKCNCPLRRDG